MPLSAMAELIVMGLAELLISTISRPRCRPRRP